jgi:uncharacterized protein (TIGR03435 family)
MTGRVTAITGALLLAGHAVCQAPAPLPAFEVVDLKRSDPSDLSPGGGRILPGGRIEIHRMTARRLVMLAYGIKEYMIAGGPKWIDSDRFDMVAKAPAAAGEPTVRLMFQSLLAERFKLAFHREEKVMTVWALTVGKRGLKFQESPGGRGLQCDWRNLEGGLRRRECRNVNMEEFARQLTGLAMLNVPGIDRPVVDETGLKGVYDLHFDVAPAAAKDTLLSDAPESASGDSGPTIFAALEEIGLKLESRKSPVALLIVDHIEPPAAN